MTARSWSVLMLLAAGCGGIERGDPFTFNRNLATSRAIEVEVESGAAEAVARVVAERLMADEDWRVAWALPGEARDARAARVLIAGPDAVGVRPLLARLERRARDSGAPEDLSAALLERMQSGEQLGLVATLWDSNRGGLPVTLALAPTAVQAALLLDDLEPSAESGWRLYDNGDLIGEGGLWFAPNSSAPPVIDIARERREKVEKEVVSACDDLEVRAAPHAEPARVARYCEDVQRALERLRQTLITDGEAPAHRLAVHVRPGIEDHLRLGQTHELAARNPWTNEVHALVSNVCFDDGGAEVARAFAIGALGDARTGWLVVGIGVDAAGTWWGRPLEEWCAQLELAELTIPVEQLVSRIASVSPHIVQPLRGLLVRHVFETRGAEYLRRLWKGEVQLELDESLRVSFQARLAALAQEHKPRIVGRGEQRMTAIRLRPFRRGVCLVDPATDPRVHFSGFGTAECATSLLDAKALGVDSISLNFWTFQDPGFPNFAGDAADPARRASASDLELAVTSAFARHFELNVMFRPQLLSSHSGGLAGWAMLFSRSQWEELFASLERVAVHYGLLAELCGAELFCFAGATPGASATRPTDRNVQARGELSWRRERWRGVAELARRAFRGGLVYAADSGFEARNVEFWDAVDFLGFELYPEIVPPDDLREFSRERAVQALVGSLANFESIASAVDRPALIVEVGFSSSAGGWRHPANPVGEVDLETQRKLYDAWTEALARTRARKLQLAGMYLWNWSTNTRAGGVEDRGFCLQNKRVEETLRELLRLP